VVSFLLLFFKAKIFYQNWNHIFIYFLKKYIYNSAKSVLEKRSVPLIAAMDQGLIEPDEAACITSLSYALRR
jgi:hypothetical protein